MKEARVLGNNIRVLLKNDQTMKQAFADALGYTPYEVEKLCDARLYTTDEDIHDIAEYFSVTPDSLYVSRSPEEYTGNGFLHCMGQFKKEENKEKVLNIFDMYCDIKELLEQ
ncbi:MAG TPA: XRE family transcriptional regulator [Roseburia sp.]|nr:XRE family transcriptional regulator [Roseburia sp.]